MRVLLAIALGLAAQLGPNLVCDAAPPVTALTCAPDGKQVFVGSQAGLQVHSWPELAPVRTLETRLSHLHHVSFDPAGQRVVAAGGSPAVEGVIEVWSWPAGELITRTRLHEDVIYHVAWRSDGAQLACASADQRVSLVEVASWRAEQMLAGHSRGVTAVAYLPGNEILMSSGLDETLRVWDLKTHTVVRSLTNHTAGVRDVAVQPGTDRERPIIASLGGDRTVRFWQPHTGRMLRFARLPADPLDLEWTLDGQRVAVACADGHLRMLDWETVQVIQDEPVMEAWAYAVCATSDPQRLVVGGAQGVLRSVALKPGDVR